MIIEQMFYKLKMEFEMTKQVIKRGAGEEFRRLPRFPNTCYNPPIL